MADRNRGDRYGGEYRSSRGPSRFSDGPVNHHHRRSPKAYRTTGFSDRLPGVDGHRRLFDSPPRHSPAEGGGGFQPMAPPQGGFNSDYQVPLSGQKRGFPPPSRGGGSPDAYDGGSFAKLFVGSVPRNAAEEDIRPLFEEHGQVIEVALIKDKRTGQQQGCCFIKYATSEEAERAIRALHNQHILPGGVGPIQVRYADGERERLGTVEYKLFVGSLNRQATEKEVEEIFSPYGRVEDVYLMRDEMKQSRGCGFVKFSHRDMAMAAINALNGIYTMRGCEQPLIVRFADPKRPRPGESRGNPAFGGPGFSPRFQAPGIRPTPNIADPMSGRMPSGAWHPMGPQDMSPSSTATSQGFGSQLIPSTLGAPPGGSFDGSFPGRAISSNFKSQQDFNHSLPQNPSGSLQISPLQKSFPSPNFSSSLQLHSQAPVSYSQTQATNTAIGQTGQLPSLHSAGQASFNPAVSSHQIIGSGTQLSVSQCQVLQSTPSATPLQTQSSSGQQQLLQPLQQPPSQLAQLLSQQTQNLQASFQSSQQAFTQLQQQLQLMQPSNQSALPQQKPQATKQQSQWPGVSPHSVSSTPAITAVADVPLTTSAAPAATMITQTVASVHCNWTEHTSPDGYKYYYNSVTGESKWEKPEELTIYEQQQQKQSVQRLTTQLHPPVLSTQQLPPNQQVQLQAQLQHQQQLQQAQLSSSETTGYSQFQGSTTSVNDPSRFQQGLQATQEWMWKNKPAA